MTDQGLPSGEPIIRALDEQDLDQLPWAEDPAFLEHMAQQLRRIGYGEIEYLVVALPRPSDGETRLVGKGCIDYAQSPGCGVLTELSVVAELQSRGIGSALIRSMEQRIRDRGLDRAEIAAETNNPRAQRLYERLGYVEYSQRPESWLQTSPDGTRIRYHTTCTWLRKDLIE